MATQPANFTVTLGDLNKILEQIKIAENHVATGLMLNLDGTPVSPLLPAGLRTVDGTYNSLLPDQETVGAADQVMPRLLDPEFLNDLDGDVMAFGPSGSGAPVVTNTDYSLQGSTPNEQGVATGSVADADPRIISNLISDQTLGNFSAVFKALEMAGSTDPMGDAALILAEPDDAARLVLAESMGLDLSSNGTVTIENLSPDIGLSPSFNGWMTLFGQFFDHGLDLIPKSGNGTVYIPLEPDDPLFDPTPGALNFMALTRAATVTTAGADGLMGTADDQTHETINTTTPFIDQNQTYTSHASHQVFLREYMAHPDTGDTIATGHLLDGANGGIANWAEVKAQALNMLGIELTDMDVLNVPLLRTDAYGKFIPGINGYAQVITDVGVDGIANTEDDVVVEGSPGTPVNPSAVGALRTGHAFLDDIAHHAAPKAGLIADTDVDLDGSGSISTAEATADDGLASTYDNELLDRHYITGDGRGNENIGLTTVHTVFHSEHNRLVEDYKQTILGSGDLATLNEWLLNDVTEVPTTPTAIDALLWDGERLFQAGRFVTEMQYQHLVFEEFARKVQPAIDPFIFSASPDLDPAIVAEFAHVVYRFGHSMLRETVDRLDINNQVVGDADPLEAGAQQIGLIQAFLNPVEFDQDGAVSAEVAAGQIIRGMTKQVGNEIDEFLTEALRNNLVGLPLDLGALNIARGRDTGVPSFNNARAQFFEATGDSRLTPYTSWTDYATHLKNPLSIINFIAAYGTHESITAETTIEGRRDAAMLLVTGDTGAPTDRLDYLNSTGAWANLESGLNTVDFWIGGLAEQKQEFGGMLGATFNFVFETQMEALQNGDRFYYLSRTQGMNLLNQLEANSFTALVMRNTDLSETGQGHLPGLLFDTPDMIVEVVQAVQMGADPSTGNPILDIIKPLFIRAGLNALDGNSHFLQFNGSDHIVMGGSELSDTLVGGLGIDTLWGDGGNDRLDGGYEADKVYGGDGDDIITNLGGDDFLFGDDGNDVIHMGSGIVLGFGGRGSDFIMTGPDTQEVFAGEGNDFILGNSGSDALLGNEGDDWIEGGEGFDGLSGENSELFFNSPIVGHDVLNGQGNDTDYDGESGDDVMYQGPGIQRSNGMFGFDWAVHKGDIVAANSDLGIPFFPAQAVFTLRDRFDSVEGLSGWSLDDILTGAAVLRGAAGGAGAGPGNPVDESDLKSQNVKLIDGLAELLGGTPEDYAAMAVNTSVIDITQGAEIILGGGGSDTIRGNLGDDILDGDAWLNTRIRVTNNVGDANTAENEWFTVDSMNEIKARMLSGEINPGQLHIVREILDGDLTNSGVDVVVFSGLREDYDITPTGVVGRFTVTDNVGTDGSDTVINVERLQFADMVVEIGGANSAPVGVLLVNDATPAENQALNAVVQFLDEDNIIPGSMTFTWQAMTLVNVGGGGGTVEVWADVGTGQIFTPGDAQVGLPLRVVASYVDGLGATETVTSSATAPVQNVNDAPIGLVAIDDLSPVVTQTINVSHVLADADGMGLVSYQWQSSVNGVDWIDIGGATGNSYMANTAGVQLRVAASYLDGNGTNETVFSVPVTSIVTAYNIIEGGAGDDPLSGTALPDMMLGLAGNDTLSGGQGDDVLDGGEGNDVMLGGAGNDTYVVDSVGDVVVELVNGGMDTVRTGLSDYQLGNNVENLELTGSADIHGVGNGLDNLLVGNSGSNRLWGLGGNDTLLGNSGNDTLNGGGGDDVMEGGGGNDLYLVDSLGDVVIELAGGGTDQVRTGLSSFTLSDEVEYLHFNGSGNFSGTGNGSDNRIWGGAGDDTLDGGAGADTMFGGAGNDTHVVDNAGDRVIEAVGGGIDTVLASFSYSLGGNVENLTMTGSGDAVLIGNALDNVIQGGAGNDDLRGNGGADTLIGGAGNDSLRGGTGNDILVFGAGSGNDTIFGFDANPIGGQDLLDISAFGISSGTFAGSVSINQIGSDTLVGIDTSTITLVGVNSANITQQDFILA